MGSLAVLWEAFWLGFVTPLGAVCVLPIYPGFLVYLSSRISSERVRRKTIFLLGLVVTSGVIVFMFLVGLIFTTLFEVSLTGIVDIVSPIAFGILLVISLILIITSTISLVSDVNINVWKFLPKGRAPMVKNPWLSAFLYGFFFGAIVIPCNPGFIAILFARAVSTVDFVENIFRFLFFGLGLGFPLLILAGISSTATDKIINFLTKHGKWLNLAAGLIMFGISLYYLIFVFDVF
ncbi:MAG: cytochrome C biogenesis protein [Chloroflexi bacterium]|jgi:cytochrome c-type biogenesis protein|nr:cytochrome C biogenesis protein [Chloroflexota bacterium]MBT7081340.1 cytochrome C biogenesis protein [Chloroflexota bacterium]MBT7290814.1 cytochrome C biogenesis protein [Chloroflexota bacterium]